MIGRPNGPPQQKRTHHPMNVAYIIVLNAIGVTLLACLFVTSRTTRTRRTLADRMLTVMIFVCGLACICDALSWIVDGHSGTLPRIVNYLSNTYLYLATSNYAYLWCLYVDLRLNRKGDQLAERYLLQLVPAAAMSLLIIANLFTPILFTVDEHNVYQRLPLSYLNYLIAFSALFFSVRIRHRYQKLHGQVRFFPIWVFIAPIFVGAALQALILGMSTAWCSVCIGLVANYMSQQNELSYIDTITDLYNRAYLDSAMSSLLHSGHEELSGIMVDMDYFKEINDTYGHSTGDKALRVAADILRASTPEGSIIIRYAGDEFIVLLKTDDPAEVEAVQRQARAHIAAFNNSGTEPWTLSFSMGGTTYLGDQQDSADSFLRRMDARMYEEKEAKHVSR